MVGRYGVLRNGVSSLPVLTRFRQHNAGLNSDQEESEKVLRTVGKVGRERRRELWVFRFLF